jgi:hypothetical protein
MLTTERAPKRGIMRLGTQTRRAITALGRSQKPILAPRRGERQEDGSPRLLPLRSWRLGARYSSCRSPPSNHNSYIITRRALPRGRGLPLYRGRVARIAPKFCAQTTAENGATPCAQRNKGSFARGVFYPLNCCTNATVRRVGYAHHPALSHHG